MSTLLTAAAARWTHHAARIDALSLRERVVVFLCLVAIVAAVFDSFLLSPLSSEAQAQAKTQQKQNEDLRVLREQFQLASDAARGAGQDPLLHAQLAEALLRQAQLSQAVALGYSGLAQQTGLRELLATVLKQHERLSLLKLSALDETQAPLGMPPPAQTPTSASAPAALQWRGVEMQISGRYLDQLHYLVQLERAIPTLHWGEMRLWSQGDGEPVLLQIQVFVPKERP